MTSVQQRLKALIENHVGSLKTDGYEILDEIAKPEPDLTELWAMTHKFKGSSGTIGFADLRAVAEKLHLRIKAAANEGEKLDEESRRLSEEMRALIDDLRPEQSALLR